MAQCRYAGCGNELYDGNKVGFCRDHQHIARVGQEYGLCNYKTREELVAEGLLPEEPVWKGTWMSPAQFEFWAAQQGKANAAK